MPSYSSPSDAAAGTRPPPNGDQELGIGAQIKSIWAEAAGNTDCPGCRKTSGAPGALCPACGSRYPSPRAAVAGAIAVGVGGVLLLLALAIQGGLGGGSSGDIGSLEGFGWLLVIGGFIGVFYSVGRSGPERQSSCCGCSCLVLVLALPAGALLMWNAGGPLMAASAIPLAFPLVWCLDASATIGWAVKETLNTIIAR